MFRSIAVSNMPNRKLSSNQSRRNIFIGVAPMLLLLSTVQALLTSSRLGGMPSPMNSLSSTIAYKAYLAGVLYATCWFGTYEWLRRIEESFWQTCLVSLSELTHLSWSGLGAWQRLRLFSRPYRTSKSHLYTSLLLFIKLLHLFIFRSIAGISIWLSGKADALLNLTIQNAPRHISDAFQSTI
jgi:hypothetical protein